MAQVLNFRDEVVKPLAIRSGQEHRIVVEVLDQRHPKKTRWLLQFAVQNAAGFLGLKGLKDAAAVTGYRHRFIIRKTWLLKRFIRETADLVATGLVAIKVDGVVVRPYGVRRA